MKRLTIPYGSRCIEFDLERRPVRTLAITVLPDGRVRVVAPLEADELRVLARVQKRGRWIVKQWERQSLLLPVPPALEFRSGEAVRYLGRQYRLRLYLEPRRLAADVKFSRSVVEVRTPTEAATGKAVKDWLRQRSASVLPARFARCVKLAERHGITGGRLSLRCMSRRWGSCLPNGRILINPDLIRMPVDCIDYVMLHELCHLKVHAHSPAFYRLLAKVLPDWKQCRARLARYQ